MAIKGKPADSKPEPKPVDPWALDAGEVTATVRPRNQGHTFRADVDMAELDDRSRPGPAWAARTLSLSRSQLVVLSRRMSYPKRVMVIAVHLIDAKPTPLLARVSECEYHSDGLYRIVLELMPLPDADVLATWFHNGNLK